MGYTNRTYEQRYAGKLELFTERMVYGGPTDALFGSDAIYWDPECRLPITAAELIDAYRRTEVVICQKMSVAEDDMSYEIVAFSPANFVMDVFLGDIHDAKVFISVQNQNTELEQETRGIARVELTPNMDRPANGISYAKLLKWTSYSSDPKELPIDVVNHLLEHNAITVVHDHAMDGPGETLYHPVSYDAAARALHLVKQNDPSVEWTIIVTNQ